MDDPPIFRVRIAGEPGPTWVGRLDDLTVTVEDGDTLITGSRLDQAALHGLLRLVRDLALPLVAVTRVDVADRAGRPDSHPDSHPDHKEDPS